MSATSPSTRHFTAKSLAARFSLTRLFGQGALKLGVFALVIDAKDDAAEVFYLHREFEHFGVNCRQLFVSLKRFAQY